MEKKSRSGKKEFIGVVKSDKMDKTIVVAVVTKVPHALYGKVVVQTTKYKADDPENTCKIGDTVEIVETRPLSKDKYFRLLRVVERAK